MILSAEIDSEEYQLTVDLVESIINKSICDEYWVDKSELTNFPPDFVSKDEKIMMEFMRFDDHSNNGKKNPTRAREAKIFEKLKKEFPNVERFFINADSGLPTEEDHNYKMYFNGFKKTVEKHIKKIPQYKINHPNASVCFLVCDESSGMYLQKESNESKLCRPHCHFADRRFIDIFINADIDYFIWFAPYKSNKFENYYPTMPTIVIYDVKNFKKNIDLLTTEYSIDLMISSEI